MNTLLPFIQIAAGVQMLILFGNFFIPKKLECRENLVKLSPIVRQVFIIHYLYILFTLLGFSVLCFFFAGQLAGASLLGRFLSGFLAIFWGARVFIQLFYYDSEFKKKNAVGNFIFVCGFSYLGIVFSVAALGIIQ